MVIVIRRFADKVKDSDCVSRVFGEEGPSVGEGRFDVTGNRNLDTDGYLHPEGSLVQRDLYAAPNDLICGDGTMALSSLPGGAGNFNPLDDMLYDLICGCGTTALINLLDRAGNFNLFNDLFNGNGCVSGDLLHRGGGTALYSPLNRARSDALFTLIDRDGFTAPNDLFDVFDDLLHRGGDT